MPITTPGIPSRCKFIRLSRVWRQIWLYSILLFSLPVVAQPTPELAKLVASNGKAYYGFGTNIATDGKTAIIASGKYDMPGKVYVFSLQNGAWQQTAILTASDEHVNDSFGRYNLGVSSNTIVIGASDAKGGGQDKQGAAYVFAFRNGAWTQTQKLMVSDLGYFGAGVTISGNKLIVGSSDGSAGHRAVCVYTLSNGTCQQTTRLTFTNEESFSDGYQTLAISGSNTIVGATRAKTSGIV